MADVNTVTIWSDWEAGWFVRPPAFADECIDSAGEALALALGRKKLDEDETRLAAILDAFYASESCTALTTALNGETLHSIGAETPASTFEQATIQTD